MGVSGSGKTTVAWALASHYGYDFLDADDFHSDEARAQMAHGVPLTDAQRAPWVARLA
ncbi:AAA family ATPase, partial [Xanthomonas sp. Kuri4-2]